ncbi:MAG TPA: phosphoglycerate kinase [Candidatus Paceibacterota bacterium]
MFKTVNEIGDVSNRRVLVRVDFNIPVTNGSVSDDFRIRKTLPTINFLREKGAKIFLVGHFGSERDESMKIVADYCKKYFPTVFAETIDKAKNLDIKSGEVVLLENLRLLDKGEVDNDSVFAKKLASLGEIYINEAFSVSHRAHASIVGLPKILPSYVGLLFAEEVAMLSKAFNPEHPFIFVSGGKKSGTKIPLIEKFLGSADKLFIGGALANDFLKAKGLSIGKSTISENSEIKKDWLESSKLILPKDVIVDRAGKKIEILAEKVEEEDKIVDAGDSFVKELRAALKEAKLVVWNGPLGLCEDGFCLGTDNVASAIADSKAFSIVGGGDTEAQIDSIGLIPKFSFVSTGGGAMLEFLASGTLPGLEALDSN